jgi:ABC-type multidrug transport system fused ATPase/permease subunit
MKEVASLSLSLFSAREKGKLFLVAGAQIALGFLDLAGVILLGLLGSLSVSGVQSAPASGRVVEILSRLGLENYPLQTQVAFLGIAATGLLALKTLISLMATKKTLQFLSRKSAEVSIFLLGKVLQKSLLEIQKNSSQETLYAVTLGVSAITTGIVGTMITLLADFSLLVILFSGLLIVDVKSAIFSLVFFASISAVLYKLMNVKVKQLSIESRETSIKVNEQILEVMRSYRESVVRNRRDYYLNQISETRYKFANVEAELGFFPNISKYVIDLALVFGALSIAALQFLFTDAKQAVGSILIFLVAGLRIGPAVLRIQQQLIQLKNGSGNAATSLELISEYSPEEYLTSPEGQVVSPIDLSEFSPALRLENVTFSYPGSNVEAIKNFSLTVMPGQSVAIVGPSGAGKTTLVDLILGIFPPTSGTIQLSNDDPISTFKKFPGSVSYVPQEIFISNGTIRENVALGYPDGTYSDDQIWIALDRAQLSTFVKSLPGLLDSKVGENGSSLSGGQRQRLGIARALFTNPKFLVLDEATSALDGEAEKLVSEAVQSLKGEVTVVLIAHRLSTVRSSDVVLYLNNGELQAIGTFDEVKREVPGFNHQAELMGL